MAELIPDEGLNFLAALALKQGTPSNPVYIGLFVGGTATTVPASTATLATMGGSFAEAAYTGYARVAVTSADWGSTVPLLSGRGCTGVEKPFPAASAIYSTAINGWFVATALTGGVCLGYSNFDEGAIPAPLALGSVPKVTPRWALQG